MTSFTMTHFLLALVFFLAFCGEAAAVPSGLATAFSGGEGAKAWKTWGTWLVLKTSRAALGSMSGTDPSVHYDTLVEWIKLQLDIPANGVSGTPLAMSEEYMYGIIICIYLLGDVTWNVTKWEKMMDSHPELKQGSFVFVKWLVQQGRITWPKGGVTHGDIKKKEGPFNARALINTSGDVRMLAHLMTRGTKPDAMTMLARPYAASFHLAPDAYAIMNLQAKNFREGVMKQTYKEDWTKTKAKSAHNFLKNDMSVFPAADPTAGYTLADIGKWIDATYTATPP